MTKGDGVSRSSDDNLVTKIKDTWDILGPVAGLLSAMAVGLIWLTRLESMADQTRQYTQEISKRVDVQEERSLLLERRLISELSSIRESMVEIKTTLKIKPHGMAN